MGPYKNENVVDMYNVWGSLKCTFVIYRLKCKINSELNKTNKHIKMELCCCCFWLKRINEEINIPKKDEKK